MTETFKESLSLLVFLSVYTGENQAVYVMTDILYLWPPTITVSTSPAWVKHSRKMTAIVYNKC